MSSKRRQPIYKIVTEGERFAVQRAQRIPSLGWVWQVTAYARDLPRAIEIVHVRMGKLHRDSLGYTREK